MNVSAAIIIDVLAVAIVIISALIGRRRGLIKTLSWIIALFLAFSLASIFSDLASPIVSEKIVFPHLSSKVQENIQPQAESAIKFPSEYAETFKKLGIPESIISDATDELSKVFNENLAEPLNALTHNIAYKITHALLFVVFFLVLFVVISLLLKIVNLAAKIPVLNSINKSLGLIFGLVFGYLIVVVLSYTLVKTGFYLTHNRLNETVILKFFCSLLPIN